MSSLQSLAQLAEQYKSQYDSGSLTADEFKELVDNLHILENIQNSAEDLEKEENFYRILMAVAQIAGAL